jgi:nonsense-mediated mRNA decay protein 3
MGTQLFASQLVVCNRIGNALHFIDPNTLNGILFVSVTLPALVKFFFTVAEVSCPIYERSPFNSLATVSDLTEFYVIDVEPLGPVRGKYALADIQVARVSDFGRNDTVFFARSHLGRVLNPGDSCMGYDLSKLNFNHSEWDALDSRNFADVVSLHFLFSY